jgi:hypothetical protein
MTVTLQIAQVLLLPESFKYNNVLLREMVEIISKVSRGSRMDQIYLPKNRVGLKPGDYVMVKPLSLGEKNIRKPYFYGIDFLEPLKLKAIEELFQIIGGKIEKLDNIIITGSFLNKGFDFEDCDILIITPIKANPSKLMKEIELRIGIKAHILMLNNHALWQGLASDPLYQLMLSCCVAKKRLIYSVKPQLNYKLLDYNLLKSQLLSQNFDILSGREKYYLVRNLIAIRKYLYKGKVRKDEVEKSIKEEFKLNTLAQIKENRLQKAAFLKRYNQLYRETFQKIMRGMHHAE